MADASAPNVRAAKVAIFMKENIVVKVLREDCEVCTAASAKSGEARG